LRRALAALVHPQPWVLQRHILVGWLRGQVIRHGACLVSLVSLPVQTVASHLGLLRDPLGSVRASPGGSASWLGLTGLAHAHRLKGLARARPRVSWRGLTDSVPGCRHCPMTGSGALEVEEAAATHLSVAVGYQMMASQAEPFFGDESSCSDHL